VTQHTDSRWQFASPRLYASLASALTASLASSIPPTLAARSLGFQQVVEIEPGPSRLR
jgi:hypothetical protein